jgi:DNA-binding FadR family transcriptional regulator
VLHLFAVSLHEIFVERIHGDLYRMEAREGVHREHNAIAKAIFAGQARKAEMPMRKHMEEFAEYVARNHPALLEEVID